MERALFEIPDRARNHQNQPLPSFSFRTHNVLSYNDEFHDVNCPTASSIGLSLILSYNTNISFPSLPGLPLWRFFERIFI